MKVSNSTNPKNNVKADYNFKKRTNEVSIELNSYKNWTHSLRVDKFTNEYHDESEVGKVYYQLVDRLLPFVKEKGPSIKQQKHCHLLTGDERKLATKIISKLHNNLDLDDETEIWQLSCGQGVRLLAVITFTDDSENVYPLFLDPHHLIYPDEAHNQKDYRKKVCKFNPSKSY
ncbi:hypothetical protein [Lactiplantibacillus plantarum]|uniref:hypothetical protein n=1 Tax=Lactiplantibacillus plantarum TaxID=1590 RepID=UPI001896DB6D|nr:hypothetical protein [Lactiplantibacillus plantarum]